MLVLLILAASSLIDKLLFVGMLLYLLGTHLLSQLAVTYFFTSTSMLSLEILSLMPFK